MDTDRVQAYLKVACAGLGFDVGEVWVTSRNSSSSSDAAKKENSNQNLDFQDGNVKGSTIGKKMHRFVQLYTSKSYNDQRCNLLSPPSETKSSPILQSEFDDATSIEKHVLSPRLVDAVSSSMKVVWANCQRSEGLLGRSDMCLQTAVGMPVAVDSNGNICIVIMFSRNNVQSNEDAMEYLQFISKSATSHSIPCLLPVVGYEADENDVPSNKNRLHRRPSYQYRSYENAAMDDTPMEEVQNRTVFPEGVTARFVSFNHKNNAKKVDGKSGNTTEVEIQSRHDLKAAPKDCFGIPMLPAFAELGSTRDDEAINFDSTADAFDEASYGVWNTIMENLVDNPNMMHSDEKKSADLPSQNSHSQVGNNASFSRGSSSSTLSILSTKSDQMPQVRIDRLEEFASAFLGMSLFDIADVWLPTSPEDFDSLTHVTTVTATNDVKLLEEFRSVSSQTLIKVWSGAVGRAFGSGNPVWSSNQNVIVDSGRSTIFKKADIKTVLAVPVYSASGVRPACVVSCYALLRIDSMPYVLRFVQQALRLLWEGLDAVVPHHSVGKDLWKELNPADLGEMAADVELHKAFLVKKRPHDAITLSNSTGSLKNLLTHNDTSAQSLHSELSNSMQSMTIPTNTPSHELKRTPSSKSNLHDKLVDRSISDTSVNANDPTKTKTISPASDNPYWSTTHNNVQEAVRSIGETFLRTHHLSVPTNKQGTKRAHMVTRCEPSLDSEENSKQSQGLFVGDNQQHYKYQKNQTYYAPTTDYHQQNIPAPQQRLDETIPPQLPQAQHISNSSNAVQDQPDPALSHNLQAQVSPVKSQLQDKNSADILSFKHGKTDQITSNRLPRKLTVQASTVNSGPKQSYNQSRPLFAPFRTTGKPNVNFPFSPHKNVEKIPIAHVNHSNNATFNEQHKSVSPNVNNNSHREDPGVAMRNIAEFNAMARKSTESVSRQSESPPPEKETWGGDQSSLHYTNGSSFILETFDKEKVSAAPSGYGQYCIPATGEQVSHPKPTVRKVCRIQGCNEPTASRRPYCVRHSGNRLCEHPSCTKCAQGATRFCIAHGGGRRCTFPGCDKGARDKFFCAAHGGGKRCSKDGCSKSAVGGSNLCTSHGGGKRCVVDGCNKSAQSSTKFCVKHGGGKKCIAEGCEKVARGKTLYCAAHGGGVRCKLEGCNRVAVGKLQLCRTHGGGARTRSPNPAATFSQIHPIAPS